MQTADKKCLFTARSLLIRAAAVSTREALVCFYVLGTVTAPSIMSDSECHRSSLWPALRRAIIHSFILASAIFPSPAMGLVPIRPVCGLIPSVTGEEKRGLVRADRMGVPSPMLRGLKRITSGSSFQREHMLFRPCTSDRLRATLKLPCACERETRERPRGDCSHY
jgi:hypothetical protein